MPIHHKKNNFEAGEELIPDIICSSLPHSTPIDSAKKSESTQRK